METLHQLILLLVALSLIGMEVDLGLNATMDDLSCVIRRPIQLLKAVAAVYVIVPIAATVMIELFPLTPVAKGGIMVMALSSVPPLAPDRAMKFGGGRAYTYGLYIAMVLLSVVLVPTLVAVESLPFHIHIPLGPLPVLQEVLLKVALPVTAGLAIRHFAPRLADRLTPLLGRLASILLLIAVVPLLFAVWPAMMRLVGNGTLLAMALIALIAIVGGHLLGGPQLGHRIALATMASTRHPGVALLIAGAAGVEKRLTAAVIAVLLVGTLVGLLYRIWLRRRHNPPAPAAAPA